MSLILNDWIATASPETTILRMTGVYTQDVYVDTCNIECLKKLSWCYEQTKGQTYATDFSMIIPTMLGVNSPRVYLWKYTVWLKTARIAKGWRRSNLNDYRFNQGTIIWENTTTL